MREMSVREQRYQAVLAVISEGHTVTEVAARFGVSRQTIHAWLAKYEAGGLEGLGDGSHRLARARIRCLSRLRWCWPRPGEHARGAAASILDQVASFACASAPRRVTSLST